MLRLRLTLGPIMIAALVLAFYLDNQLDQIDLTGTWLQQVLPGLSHLPPGLLMLVMILALTVLTAGELCAIFDAKGIAADRLMVTLAAVAGCLLMYALGHGLSGRLSVAVFASVQIALFLATLVRHSWAQRRTAGAVSASAATMFALLYMGLLPGFLLVIRREYSAWVVLAIILIVKACDSGAYFTGRALGRRKLIAWLSPGKTWEGLIGGVAASALAAAGLAALNNAYDIGASWQQLPDQSFGYQAIHFNLWRCAAAGAAIGLVGQFGDLVASLFKRDADIKDSGSSIPGFGGFLDIVDSPVVAAPLAYWLLMLGSA